MNRQQAKEIAALSAEAYAAAGFYNQEWMEKWSRGFELQNRPKAAIEWDYCTDLPYFKSTAMLFRIAKTQIIDGFECPAPLYEMPEDENQVVFFESAGFKEWHTSSAIKYYVEISMMVERGIVYDTAEKAAIACKLRHGVAP